jgi:hypothetical protein
MWRRMNREDLIDSNPILPEKELHGALSWRVYEDYEFLPSAVEGIDSLYIQAAAPKGGREPEYIKEYEPLTDTPYLFLDFARIIERKDPREALWDWFREYGLLGLTPRNPRYWEPPSPAAAFAVQIHPMPAYDDRGGPGDFLLYIWALAHELNVSLVLYEASVGRDEEKLEHTLFAYEDPEHVRQRRQDLEVKAEATGASWLDILIDAALWTVFGYTIGNIQAYTYPDITMPQLNTPLSTVSDVKSLPPLTVDQLTRSWGSRNLLGAMSLQFYWLMTSASELSRCKYCGRVISYAPLVPAAEGSKSRKPRKDKKFCDSQCRQNYHYHYRIKSRR